MSRSSSLSTVGAVLTLLVAAAAAGVIAFGFLAPERMLDTVGVVGYLLAIAVMVGCAIVSFRYDLRGILGDPFG